MRSASFVAAVAATASVANGLNILITNDDGFGTSNIREMYKAMKAFGHNCYIVASTQDESGNGGRAVFTTEANLTADTEFGIVKKGAPSIGTDPSDSHIWYYNGTPTTQVFTALDYILPNFGEFKTPDLVMSGPNFGLNVGPFLYTLSGTIGATYAAIERGIPAIAYSGGYSVQTPYYYLNATTAAGLQDPATLIGRLAANLANEVIKKAAGGQLMPKGYGLSVNIPYLTSYTNNSCVNPPYILTRMTGDAIVDSAVYNKTTGLFTYGDIYSTGGNQCINGDCSLPGETDILTAKCMSSVSVFTVDYDAPYAGQCANATNPYAFVPSLVQKLNSTTALIGGLGANATTAGVSTSTATSSSKTTTTTATSSGSSSKTTTMSSSSMASTVMPITATKASSSSAGAVSSTIMSTGSSIATTKASSTATSAASATSSTATAGAVVGRKAEIGFAAIVGGLAVAML